MSKNTRKFITLLNGEVAQIVHDTASCPICLSGSMNVQEILDDDIIVMECPSCGSKLQIPFISLSENNLDK